MLLQKLNEYAERMVLSPTMYKKVAIPWFIDLDLEGRLIGKGFVATSSGKKKDRGKELMAPHPGARTSGIKPNLLADKAEYAIGLVKDEKSADRHRAFVTLIGECWEKTKEKEIASIKYFLETRNLSEISLPKELTPDQWVTFRVEGNLPIDFPSVQSFWARRYTAVDDEEKVEGITTPCMICGQICKPANPHPVNIKKIPGGQTSGLALISANSIAFESYGLSRSEIAPTCHYCAERYATAANALIEDERTSMRVGPIIYLFWTRKENSFSPVSFFFDPRPEEVKELISSAWRGREYTAMDEDAFYATALSASGARVVVRDWLETTIPAVRYNIARWFMLQRLVDTEGQEGNPLGLFPLAAALYQNVNKEMQPNIPTILLQVAIKGGPIPDWLLFQAVKRNRAEQRVTRPRAALIKMVLLAKISLKGDDPLEKLDDQNTHPAYLCGRLLAEIEAVQKAAIPGANTTVVDRFFGTASSAPASVFGRLLRGTQNHLGKLRKERPGTYYALQQRLEQIQANLTAFPKLLNLEEQGLFSLGYYHQRGADRAAAKAHKELQILEDNIISKIEK